VITNDVSVVQTGVPMVKDVMSSPIRAIGGLALLFYLNWQLALISLVAVPFVALAIIKTSRRVRQSQKEVQENISDMTATMQESLNAVRVVRAFSAEERQLQHFSSDTEATYASNMKVVHRMAALKPLVEVIGAAAIALIIYLGANYVYSGAMTAGDLFSFVYLLDVIKTGATGIGNIGSVYGQVVAATDHIYKEVFDVKTDVPDDEDALTIESVKGRVEFHDVSFSYPDGTPALHNVSFAMEPGESIALVGRSGAGKSTIADLLLRFYDPTEGSITFDGIDLRRLDSQWLRRQIGVVPQQTMLFAGTIEDNIRFGRPAATSEEVHAAAWSAHADEFVSEMPDG
jgi:subfamily B ATP-binding cassette protein MsbA